MDAAMRWTRTELTVDDGPGFTGSTAFIIHESRSLCRGPPCRLLHSGFRLGTLANRSCRLGGRLRRGVAKIRVLTGQTENK